MDNERLLERERYQMDQIRELDLEELQVEEVDDSSDDDDLHATGYGGAGSTGELTFNTCLASLHTYLGEVEDTHGRMAFLEGGAILNLPLFYLEGVVLFPEATLPLRVIHPNFISAVEKALTQVDAPYTIGVVRVHRDPDNGRPRFATIGTTAEIRQYRRLEDGSLNVVTRGQQRFRLRRRGIDVEGAPCGEVQIIQEDQPLRTPCDALGKLTPLSNLRTHSLSRIQPSIASRPKLHQSRDEDNVSESNSEESFEGALSLTERRIHHSAVDSCYGYDIMDESTSSDDDKFLCESDLKDSESIGSLHSNNEKQIENAELGLGSSSTSGRQSCKGEEIGGWKKMDFDQFRRVPRAFWPYWVYRMYDSYCLAERASDMWKKIVGASSMDALVRKPGLLSFYIASKIPVSESTRQELLEIDGISYRLRREIELLESVNLIRCKKCQTVIARRSDMLVMSSEGPLGAYVNPQGYVHEIMTLYSANGLALIGLPETEYSWFPGYAWTIADCVTCETQMGWLFTATNKKLKPRSFWGIRSSQVADDMQ
jgi:cereblon